MSDVSAYASRLNAPPKAVRAEPSVEPGTQVGKQTRVEAEGFGPRPSRQSASTSSARGVAPAELAEPAQQCSPDEALSFALPAPLSLAAVPRAATATAADAKARAPVTKYMFVHGNQLAHAIASMVRESAWPTPGAQLAWRNEAQFAARVISSADAIAPVIDGA